jgi:hypothetical protein
MEDNFWDESGSKDHKFGSDYPPVKLYVSMIDISKLNVSVPVVKTVILSDGKEIDVEMILETDRDTFSRDLKSEVIDDK